MTYKLIGADDGDIDGSHAGGYFILIKFAAVSSGELSEIRVKCSDSGNLKVAIYADNAGEPGTRLAKLDTSTAVVAGWNTLALESSVAVVSGTSYWLAFISDAQSVGYDITTGDRRLKAATYATFAFPDPAGSGFDTYTTTIPFIAGWGFTALQAVGGGSLSIAASLSSIYRQVKSVGGELTIAGAVTSIYRQLMNVGGATGEEGSAEEGPNSPGTMADDASVGTEAWVNPNNAKVSDNVYATAYFDEVSISHYLKATNFGFSIPTGATINGILVEIERRDLDERATDSSVKIIKADGSIGSENKADTVNRWPFSDTYKAYGGATDLWSETWTPEDINDTDFGVVLSTIGGFTAADVDHIRITVYYTTTTPWITGSLNRLIKLGVGGAVTTAGALNLLIKKSMGGSVGIAGALSSIYRRFVSVGGGEVSAPGALNRLILVGVGGAVTMAGALGRLIKRGVGSGSITIAGALSQCFKMAVGQGAVGIAGALTYWWPRVLHAIAFTAAYRKARAVTSLYRKFKAFTAAYRKLKIITAGYRAAKAVTSLYRKVKAITRGG